MYKEYYDDEINLGECKVELRWYAPLPQNKCIKSVRPLLR